jgi:hypothetical protein
MVEFGSVRNNQFILTEPQVRFLAEIIPSMCESRFNHESTTIKDCDVRLSTTGNINVASLYLGTRYISLKLEELRYLRDMFYIIHNQQILYMLALPDVLTYATVAQNSSTYIEPHENASQHIFYPQLFEELMTILFH